MNLVLSCFFQKYQICSRLLGLGFENVYTGLRYENEEKELVENDGYPSVIKRLLGSNESKGD